jgi:small subunit ribosomal protein S1
MEENKELLTQEPAEESKPQENQEEATSQPSMEDLLAQEELSLDLPRSGQLRSGVVVGINEDQILVSIGTKSEGIIPGKEISQLEPEERDSIELGQEISVYVVTPEDSNGNLILSRLKALEEEDWDQAEKYVASGEIHEGVIAGYNKGGLIVKMGRLRGFVPASQVSLSRRLSYGGSTPDQRWAKMTGQDIIVKTIEVDRERRRLIFSELAALQESREIFKERLLEEIKEGETLNGRVTSLADFGAFVNINGADGLVHLTEVSWEHITHPSQVLKVGQEVKVKVINIDEENKRIGLSIRQLQSDPWPEKVAVFREGQLVQAKIVRLVKFGAFARIEGTDLEGLIHISELSEQRVEHPKEIVKDGEVLTLRIIKIDPNNHRIGLSLRKVHSLAYADLDLKMAMAETNGNVELSETEEEPAPEAPDTADASINVDVDVSEPVETEPVEIEE